MQQDSLKFAVGIADGANAVQPAMSASAHAAYMEILAMALFICFFGPTEAVIKVCPRAAVLGRAQSGLLP
jgi:hypothetical protein